MTIIRLPFVSVCWKPLLHVCSSLFHIYRCQRSDTKFLFYLTIKSVYLFLWLCLIRRVSFVMKAKFSSLSSFHKYQKHRISFLHAPKNLCIIQKFFFTDSRIFDFNCCIIILLFYKCLHQNYLLALARGNLIASFINNSQSSSELSLISTTFLKIYKASSRFTSTEGYWKNHRWSE